MYEKKKINYTFLLKRTKGKQFEISFLSKSKIKFRAEFSASESPSNYLKSKHSPQKI